MPKKKPTTEEAAAAATEEVAAEKPAPAPKKQTRFTFTEKEPEGKMAPQCTGILNILREAGKDGLTRAELTEAMDGVIETRQPLGRILSYYQKKLVESGAVTMVEEEAK